MPGDLFSSLLMLRYCVFVFCMCWSTLCIGTGTSQPCVLQYIVCCNSLVFFTSVSADRNGMAASKSSKELPIFPGKHILKHVFPTCHVKASKFYQSCMPPIASSSSSSFTSSSSTPPSATSSRSQWALPGLNRERQISVGLSGPNCDCQISVGTARHRERQITVGTATLYRMGGPIPAS